MKTISIILNILLIIGIAALGAIGGPPSPKSPFFFVLIFLFIVPTFSSITLLLMMEKSCDSKKSNKQVVTEIIKYAVLILVLIVGAHAFFRIANKPSPPNPPPSYRAVDGANVVLDNVNEYKPTWRGTSELLTTLLGMGYLKIGINNLEYEYYCASCEDIPCQGTDTLILNKKDLGYDFKNPEPYFIASDKQYDFNQIREWCVRNKGKYPMIYFGEGVKFYVVEEVTQLFNYHGLKFYLSTFEDEYTGIKIDLYERSSNAEKIEESKELQPTVKTPVESGNTQSIQTRS